MDALTKLIVLGSLAGALIYDTWIASRTVWAIPWLAVLGSAAGFWAGRRWPDRSAGVVMAAGYLVPIAFALTTGFGFPYKVVWTWTLLSATCATADLAWHFPKPLRFPLIVWAVCVALTWPIVIGRELDWMPELLWSSPSVRSVPSHAVTAALTITTTAQLCLVGLLWVDWLFSRFGPGRFAEFERAILRKMFFVSLVPAALAVYQGFVDLSFFSASQWAVLGRAGGGMLDANASGALGALWIPIAIGFAATARTKGAAAAMALAAAVLTLSVWATGSRTALLAAVAGAASLPHLAARSPGSRRPLLIAAAAMLALIAGTAVVARSSTVGPIARVRAEFAPLVNSGGAVRALEELWSRNGYGTASVRMFQDSPLTGVGVGAFPALVHEATGLPADYAQNWIRHQLVELGVVGSLGLLLWMAVLAVTFPRQPQDPRFSVRLLTMKYAIAGVGLASMLGVPGQNLFVALTVWTLLFAVLTLTGFEAVKTIDHGRRGLAPAAALVWAVVFAAATVYTGLTELRPPVRAKRLGYPYQYGFIDRVDGPNGATRSLAQGLAVPLAATGTVKLTFWVEHPDADTRPVFVDVRLDGRRIVHGQFSRGTPLIQVERVPAGQRYILETEVDRTFMPPDTPGREGGVNVRWEYLEDAKRP